jgi:hypothetical protein
MFSRKGARKWESWTRFVHIHILLRKLSDENAMGMETG